MWRPAHFRSVKNNGRRIMTRTWLRYNEANVIAISAAIGDFAYGRFELVSLRRSKIEREPNVQVWVPSALYEIHGCSLSILCTQYLIALWGFVETNSPRNFKPSFKALTKQLEMFLLLFVLTVFLNTIFEFCLFLVWTKIEISNSLEI